MIIFRITKILCCCFISSFMAHTAAGQLKIEGKVVQENDQVIPFASIKLAHDNEGIVSDSAGNFVFHIHQYKKNDTLLISSIGYEPVKIPLSAVTKKGRYVLKANAANMETVVVRSFGKEDMAGAQTDVIGYFRSWNQNNTGGEIGRAIHVPHKEYQVSRVRFKIFSSCDTCIIRVHIREMVAGLPGRELLRVPVTESFYNAATPDKTYDIDLLPYRLLLDKENIFVSFEVLKGSSGLQPCSLSFVGSEPGTYMYKSKERAEWQVTEDYAIHMKVFFRYD